MRNTELYSYSCYIFYICIANEIALLHTIKIVQSENSTKQHKLSLKW